MWPTRGGVADRVVAAHVGAVGKPDLVATLRMRGGDPGVGAINQELDRSKAFTCSRYGALLDAEAQGAEAALGACGESKSSAAVGSPGVRLVAIGGGRRRQVRGSRSWLHPSRGAGVD